MKKIIAILFVVLCLTGCNGQEEAEQVLWVVTEKSNSDGMNLQAEIIAERMEEAYPGLTVNLEILPTDDAERELRLNHLRVEIMSGNGPDIYLLPTGNVLTYDRGGSLARKMLTETIEPLFSDATQAMYNGVFLDVSGYYDADQNIRKDLLKTEVMDAGTLGEARYILPLRYNQSVLLTGKPQQENRSIMELVSAALEQENVNMTIGLQMPDSLELLPEIFDYETGNLLISVEEITAYMRLYQQWFAVSQPETAELLDELELAKFLLVPKQYQYEWAYPDLNLGSFNSMSDYFAYELYWDLLDIPMYTCNLSDTLQSAAIAKVIDHDLYMYPLQTTDGKTVAEVTYYGAVGSSCAHPELAYEFISQMLSEEFQWEIYRPRGDRKNDRIAMLNYREPQCPGLVESSFPVLAYGAVPGLWDILQYQGKGYLSDTSPGGTKRSVQFQGDFCLEDSDIPAVAFPIDEVHFPVYFPEDESLSYALSQLNNEDGTPTDADIDALAQSVYQSLWWHLAEG